MCNAKVSMGSPLQLTESTSNSDTETAEIQHVVALWEWQHINGWLPFDASVCKTLESARSAGNSKLNVTLAPSCEYSVDLDFMWQQNSSTGTMRHIRRRFGAGAPAWYWWDNDDANRLPADVELATECEYQKFVSGRRQELREVIWNHETGSAFILDVATRQLFTETRVLASKLTRFFITSDAPVKPGPKVSDVTTAAASAANTKENGADSSINIAFQGETIAIHVAKGGSATIHLDRPQQQQQQATSNRSSNTCLSMGSPQSVCNCNAWSYCCCCSSRSSSNKRLCTNGGDTATSECGPCNNLQQRTKELECMRGTSREGQAGADAGVHCAASTQPVAVAAAVDNSQAGDTATLATQEVLIEKQEEKATKEDQQLLQGAASPLHGKHAEKDTARLGKEQQQQTLVQQQQQEQQRAFELQQSQFLQRQEEQLQCQVLLNQQQQELGLQQQQLVHQLQHQQDQFIQKQEELMQKQFDLFHMQEALGEQQRPASKQATQQQQQQVHASAMAGGPDLESPCEKGPVDATVDARFRETAGRDLPGGTSVATEGFLTAEEDGVPADEDEYTCV